MCGVQHPEPAREQPIAVGGSHPEQSSRFFVVASEAGKFCETFEDVRNYYVTAGGGRDNKCSPDVDIGPAELFLRDLEMGACHQR